MEIDLISVVIPIYNVEQYLKKCIDSVINQTYNNIEIILVDDGSPDDCGNICDEYAKKDSRIKVIHKINGGLSDARNAGIEIASGKYITFIDSDDIVENDYIEYLYKLLKKYNTKISICSYYVITEDNKKIDYGKDYKEQIMAKEECLERMLCEEGFSVSAWAKMYDIQLFNNVRYPYGKICEDNGTTYKLIDQVDKVAYGNIPKYYYLKRSGSIMSNNFNIKKMDMIELTDEMCDFLYEKYPIIENSIRRRKAYARFNILRQMLNNKNVDKNMENEIVNWILDNKKEIINNPKSSLRDKVALICLMINKRVFRLVWNIYSKIKY